MSDEEQPQEEEPQQQEEPQQEEEQPQQQEEQPQQQQEEDRKESSPAITTTTTSTSTSSSSGPIPDKLDVTTAWKAVSAESPPINWYLCGVDKKIELVFKVAGKGGFEELTNVLKNSSTELLFGLLRVNSNDRGGSKRAKFVFIRFVGTNVSVMQKGKLTPRLGKIGDSFPVKHMTYDLTEDLSNFTIETLAKEMLRVGGAHKPDSFDFGLSSV